MRRELLAVAVVSLALTLWCFWPLPLQLTDHSAYLGAESPGITADFDLAVWILSWDAHAFLTAPWRIFNANTFYPSPWSLAYSEHLLGLAPLFAPWYWATGNPILAANFVILTTQVLTALAMYAFLRRWTPPAAAGIGAFFFAYSGWRMASVAYFHIHAVQLVPIVLLFTERWLDRRDRLDWLVLTVALVFQALTSVYVAYVVFVVWGLQLVSTLWFRRDRLDCRALLGLGVAGGVAVLFFGASCLPYLELRRLGVIRSFENVVPRTSPTELGLDPFFAATAVKDYLASKSVGLLGGLLAVLGVWQAGVERRHAAVLGITLAVSGILLAVGPGILVNGSVLWSPYRVLQALIPGFATIRIPARFLTIAQLGLALLASLGAARLFALLRLRSALQPAAALVLVAASLVVTPLPQLPLHQEVVGSDVPPAYRWLATGGEGRPLLELPYPNDLGTRARRMYFSTYHWLPTVDGYSGYPVRTAKYIYGIASGLPEERALQKLADSVDVGWILVHLDESLAAERWRNGRLPSGLERFGQWQNDLLLRVTRAGDQKTRARLLSTTETMGGSPLVELSGPCPGRIVLRSSPIVSPMDGKTRIAVEVRNESSSTWPGFALLPRHVVHLRARWTDPTGVLVGEMEAPLPRDLAPNEATEVRMAMPVRPSDLPSSLTLDLIQLGDAPLADCGVTPLKTDLTSPAKTSA